LICRQIWSELKAGKVCLQQKKGLEVSFKIYMVEFNGGTTIDTAKQGIFVAADGNSAEDDTTSSNP